MFLGTHKLKYGLLRKKKKKKSFDDFRMNVTIIYLFLSFFSVFSWEI